MTPTQRSIKLLKDEGWRVENVEKFNHITRKSNDLWGFADLEAKKAGEPTMYVQVTDGSHFANRIKKVLANDNARYFVCECGDRVVVHGWRTILVPLKNGKKAPRWRVREVEMMQEDFDA